MARTKVQRAHYQRCYYLAHRAELLARRRERVKQNPQRVSEYNKAYYQRHKTEMLAQRQERRKQNPFLVREVARRWGRNGGWARQRERTVRLQFGLSPQQYAELLARPCDICGRTGKQERHGKLCFDHNHITGQFRGMLCSRCNSAIGLLQDNPELIRKAAEYLGSH